MPLASLLQRRTTALQKRLLSEVLLLELEAFLMRQWGALRNKAQQDTWNHDYHVLSYDQEQKVHLEDALQLDHLLLLKDAFTNQSTPDTEPDGEGRAKDLGCARSPRGQSRRRKGTMTLEEFQAALKALLGSEQWTSHTALLFNKVDASCDGFVDWDKFCSYVLLQYREKEYISQPREPFLNPWPAMKRCTYNKQEPTNRILVVSYPPPLRFVSVSREGTLTIWDNNLEALKAQELPGDCSEGDGNRRKFRKWSTDAVYMPNVHKIAVATTSRDIHFMDVSTSNCFEEFHLFGIKNVPTTLYYWCDAESPEQRSILLWGDDSGSVNLLWFLQPHTGMFENTFSNEIGPKKVFMQDIQDHSRLVSYQLIPAVHQGPINKIIYEPCGERIITSSGSASNSVVIMDVSFKKKSYMWHINKGVTCFDFNKSLSLLVTAGMDLTVRLWNQYVTSRPVAALQGHCSTVLDVAIYEPLGQIFSYSKDAVLKVWDIPSQRCLRTLLLKFPCMRAFGVLEHGNRPFLLLPDAPHVLLVSCRDYLALLRLQHGGSEATCHDTQSAPISCALYNDYFKQLVISCIDSTVSVWDVETGGKLLQLSRAHGQEAVTCMAFDPSQHRLITGACNGTIKVWNVLNGHNFHKLETVAEAAITGAVCLQDNRILAVGWSQKITQYNITDPNSMYVKADLSWKSGQLHKEDILAVDYCPAQGLLATGSFDGEVIIWTLDTQKPLLHLNRPKGLRVCSDSANDSRDQQRAKLGSYQPTSRHESLNFWDLGVAAPVDKLLFLQWRAHGSHWRNRAILVSAEAGCLCWWSMAGPEHKHGHFYAPKTAHESVLGLSSDRENRLLVSGDTAGCIQVWDISQFALGLVNQTSADRPPLLHCWRAHKEALVSVVLLVFEGQLFLASASTDQTARLWTGNGRYVGTFGQEHTWNLQDPDTFQHPGNPWTCSKDSVQEEDPGCDQSRSTASVAGHAKSSERAGEAGRTEGCPGQRVSPHSSDYGSRTPCPFDSRELAASPISPSDGPAQAENTGSQVPLGLQVSEGLHRRLAARQERRLNFGDIDASKLSHTSGVFTPFQTLATPECQQVQLPAYLPMSNWMLRQGLRCETDTDLVSFPLSSRSSSSSEAEYRR